MFCGDRAHPCEEGRKPVAHRRWVVVRRNARCSAFDGYRHKWSPYSDVQCHACGALWRTKAAYVDELPSGELRR